MNIYNTAEPLYFHCDPEHKTNLYIHSSGSKSFRYIDSKLVYENYLNEESYGCFYMIRGTKTRLINNDGKLLLRRQNGELLGLPELFVNSLTSVYKDNHDGDYFVDFLFDYPEDGDRSLVSFNLVTEEVLSSSIRATSYNLIDDCVYGFDKRKKEAFKLNFQLEYIWTYKPQGRFKNSSIPIKYNNTIIVFLGPEIESRNLVEGRSQYIFSGGVLAGLNDADGSLAWQLDIPNAADNYQLEGDVLYVVSLNEILLIKPETGDMIDRIDTETSELFDRSFGPSVYVDESYIYYSHYDDAIILIYDKNSLALQRRIDLPLGYYAKGHNFHDEVSGKQYFTLANRTQYVAQGPVLEIDPQNLDEEVGFEQEPDIEIKLQASPDNIDERRLVIRLTSESLDDALRFGEIYTRDEAQRYSYNYVDMTFQGRPFTPEKSFNGVIQFIYSGCDQSAAVVNEHLRVMEKRFSKWNEKEGFFACTDKKKPTRLIAEYVE